MKLGDGKETKVWTDNWIIDPLPRPATYLPDADVDLTLCVDELLFPNTEFWDVQKVRSLFVEDDANLILAVKMIQHNQDLWRWGFTKDGVYSTRSGYRLLESLRCSEAPMSNKLPPIKRNLLNNIWKLPTSPQIIHFIWRTLSVAVAVSDQLRSRSIQVDPKCKLCGDHRETICHMLF